MKVKAQTLYLSLNTCWLQLIIGWQNTGNCEKSTQAIMKYHCNYRDITSFRSLYHIWWLVMAAPIVSPLKCRERVEK